jgi:pantoate--beta-alanine ligase
MIIYKTVKDIEGYLRKCRYDGKTIGFVPTMGALHDGHISLIRKCKEQNDITACSIFINPTQFNNPDDLKKYPVTIEKDIYLLEQNGCDLLFFPDVEEVYPKGLKSKAEQFDLGYLETILEGKYRPGHFQGVCQVVKRLLEIVNPHKLYLGQKDYQQCMVIKRLCDLMKSNTQVVICPTMREPDGLAMSSRNLRLNETERRQATEIYRTLDWLKGELRRGDIDILKREAIRRLTDKGFKVDYVEIAEADTLKTIENWDGKTALVSLAAAFVDEVRLIDNILLS